ncbi:helix-turn-helix domain-containing protein [Streptomyces zhihengii]|uniref:Helix-turn-helix transcriptional regulator n=1 Tax=Streptomyces zhihengii TaxID=1818004 RepID=A0ABS2V6Q1_9ACTN|nr:helix-turn-helix transcriptional regulator [Streptomyces zhihengii]MBM9624687.1 helix-turn-helix transcriptional regulator [Streptomyces zhihengii]
MWLLVPRVILPDPDLLRPRRRIARQILGRARGGPVDAAGGRRADRSSYQDIEYGNVAPMLDSLLRIADAIGVPLSELVRE